MIIFVAICLFLGSHVSATPIITDPCGGSNPVSGSTGSIQGHVSMGAVRDMAIEARVYAKILVDKLTNPDDPRIRVPTSTATHLTNSSLEHYPKDRKEYDNTDIETRLKMQNDYDNVSVIAIFASEVYNDEVKAKYFYNFEKEMFDFKTAISHLLCKINMAAKTAGIEITKNVQESVMLSKYRNMMIVYFRNMRDYMVFRDARGYLDAMSQDYS